MKRNPDAAPPPALPAGFEFEVACALAPIAPEPSRAEAMRHALLARARNGERFVTVRARDGAWTPLAPKVALKMLEDDGAMQSFLLKFEAGGTFGAHTHAGDELCVVLEGDFRLGDLTLEAGDYHVARGGTQHGDASSRTGCLLFLRVPSGAMPYA